MIFVDIHSHHKRQTDNIVTVYNLPLIEAADTDFNDLRYFSTGLHPWDLDKIDAENAKQLLEQVNWKRVSLIGECGFDKLIATDFERQKNIFLQHVTLSEKYRKPLIIHCVGYFNELFQIRKELKPTQRWIIHGFRGKPQLAQQALKNGFDLSFGEKHNAESVLITPLSNLFVETDESTVPIEQLYLQIAEIKSCTVGNLKAGRELFESFC